MEKETLLVIAERAPALLPGLAWKPLGEQLCVVIESRRGGVGGFQPEVVPFCGAALQYHVGWLARTGRDWKHGRRRDRLQSREKRGDQRTTRSETHWSTTSSGTSMKKKITVYAEPISRRIEA